MRGWLRWRGIVVERRIDVRRGRIAESLGSAEAVLLTFLLFSGFITGRKLGPLPYYAKIRM
jgi:hypothetical protein